jgi:hypothetical protein
MRGCLSAAFCIFSFDPPSGRFENGGTAFGADRYAIKRAREMARMALSRGTPLAEGAL